MQPQKSFPIYKILSPKDRGSVSVDGKNNQIIITDTAKIIAQAEEITRQIDKVTSQVIIEARVVEVSQSTPRNWAFPGPWVLAR
jgi:type IV pilus assembly protein PilQ